MIVSDVLSSFGDALEFIFTSQESRAGGSEVGGTQLLGLLWDHVWLSAVALLAGIAVALPLGLWLGHSGRGSFVPLGLANVGRAVPSIALIVFFVAYLGTGYANVILALALLAVPPVLANAYVGVREADRDAVDAARGMGMTGAQVVRRVELPLAMPLVMGGVRTSAVNVVATATIAPLAGVSSLGDPIISFGVYGDAGRLGASIVVALLAVATELGLAWMQRRVSTPTRRGGLMKHRRLFALLSLFACVLAIGACGGSDQEGGTGGSARTATEQRTSANAIQRNARNAQTTITVGSKNFTEQKVLGEIYAQGLEAAGYRTDKELNLGDEKTAQRALQRGSIDGYPEYTGTALLSLCDVSTDQIPKDPQQAFTKARDCFRKDGLTAFPPTPFTSSNEVGTTKQTADKLGLTKISDLASKGKSLTLYGSPECRTRRDCLLGLQQVYGLKFKKFVPINLDQRHEVLKSGQADLSIVFTTDPQIKRDNEVLLEDDKHMFPPYNSTFLVTDKVASKAGPDLAKTIDLVNQRLTADVMQELNARVDLDKDTPAEAAQAYLKQFKLIS